MSSSSTTSMLPAEMDVEMSVTTAVSISIEPLADAVSRSAVIRVVESLSFDMLFAAVRTTSFIVPAVITAAIMSPPVDERLIVLLPESLFALFTSVAMTEPVAITVISPLVVDTSTSSIASDSFMFIPPSLLLEMSACTTVVSKSISPAASTVSSHAITLTSNPFESIMLPDWAISVILLPITACDALSCVISISVVA